MSGKKHSVLLLYYLRSLFDLVLRTSECLLLCISASLRCHLFWLEIAGIQCVNQFLGKLLCNYCSRNGRIPWNWGLTGSGEQLCWEGPGAPCRRLAEYEPERVMAAKKINSIVGCLYRSRASQSREIVIFISMVLFRQQYFGAVPRISHPFWGSTVQKRH